MDKYMVSSAPYLRSADHKKTTERVMIDLLIALSPVILFSIFKNVIFVLIKGNYSSIYQAIYPLITLIISPIFSLLLEALCLYIMKKKEIKSFKDLMVEVKNGFGLFPGLFIVLISPVYIKMWVLLVSIAVGEVVGKMLFGGFGQNIFNPALIGRAFMAFAFSYNGNNLLTVSAFDALNNGYLNAFEVTSYDIVGGATPLTNYHSLGTISYDSVIKPYGGLLNFFTGMVPGSLGETSFFACLVGYIYLSVRKVIDYKVPLIYIGVVFIASLISGLIMHQGLYYPLFMISSGGLAFGAVFMATEPVTSPKTDFGRVMYAMLLGVLTLLFRMVGSYPEGVATAIVTMNIFGLVINKYTVHVRVDGKLDKNEIPGFILFLVIFISIFIYVVVSTVGGLR